MHNSITQYSRVLDTACTRCGKCQVGCSFLKEYGLPGDIAHQSLSSDTPSADPFHCSLCGLCREVCPEKLNPEALFLSMRRERVQTGTVDLKPYRPILTYESLGDSSMLSTIQIPDGGDTVFFPGCALPGTRPQVVRRLFRSLQQVDSKMGVALGCCLKPSHDLGRQDRFETGYARLLEHLLDRGVSRVLTACPNCYKIFSTYGEGVDVVSVYEVLADTDIKVSATSGDAVVHDPCPIRHATSFQDAVRTLAQKAGLTIKPIKKERELTQCCGEGGMVGFVRPEFARAWTAKRVEATKGAPVVTACAGCTGFLGQHMDVTHILDVLFNPEGKTAHRSPMTYWQRWRLKRWFNRNVG